MAQDTFYLSELLLNTNCSGAGYVPSFTLKLSTSAVFSLIVLFTACFKRIIDSLLSKDVLYVHIVKLHLSKTIE